MTTAVQACAGQGSRLITNGRTRLRLECATCGHQHAPLPASQRLDLALAALAHQETDGQVQEIERELAGTGCFALMNGRGDFTVFSSPASPETGTAPGATLSPARRHDLEMQRDILLRLAKDTQSSESARTRAAQDAAKIMKLLTLPTTAQA